MLIKVISRFTGRPIVFELPDDYEPPKGLSMSDAARAYGQLIGVRFGHLGYWCDAQGSQAPPELASRLNALEVIHDS